MTVVESIIKWFASFNINDIDTDALGGQSASYGIAKEPVQNVKTYISGRKVYTDYYEFLARLDSKTDAERNNNHVFMEKLSEWIYAITSSFCTLLPTFFNNSIPTNLSISSSFFFLPAPKSHAIFPIFLASIL